MKQSVKLIAFFALFLAFSVPSFAQAPADKIVGLYQVVSDVSKEVVKVQITKKGNTYHAQIVWIERPLDKDGNVKRDRLNPDPKLRNVTADKIVIACDLKYDSKDNEWTNGKVYDPDSGKTYKATLHFDGNTKLKVRGYIGVPTIGRTLIWNKIG